MIMIQMRNVNTAMFFSETEVVGERGDDDPFLKTTTDIMKEIEERIIKTLGENWGWVYLITGSFSNLM